MDWEGQSEKPPLCSVYTWNREKTTKESDEEWRLKVSWLETLLLSDFKEALHCSYRVFEVEVN